jgi:hypothetical protein
MVSLYALFSDQVENGAGMLHRLYLQCTSRGAGSGQALAQAKDAGGDDQCKSRQRWEIRRLGYIVETNEHYRQRILLRYAQESMGSA